MKLPDGYTVEIRYTALDLFWPWPKNRYEERKQSFAARREVERAVERHFFGMLDEDFT